MSKPDQLQTRIFLDGGDPAETKRVRDALGFLDGQTTNPSLVAKHPTFQACKERSIGCTNEDLWSAYRDIVTELSPMVPDSVSIEVYADTNTTMAEMVEQGRELAEWIPNPHVKLPITTAGLGAAEQLVADDIRVNMTLCFTQAQVAAVYAATRGAPPGAVYVSPFVGRLDDRGEDGMSLIQNIMTMLESSDGHVESLVASVRSLEHLYASLALGVPRITAPADILLAWAEDGLPVPDASYQYDAKQLTTVPYESYDLTAPWDSFDIEHPLTTDGLARFAADWNAVLST